jgi:hypothetical protein
MKITFLTPHVNISGGVKAILEYASRLAKKGHEVTVIAPQPTFAKVRIKGRAIPTFLPRRPFMNWLKHKPHWIDVAADIKYVSSWVLHVFAVIFGHFFLSGEAVKNLAERHCFHL